MSDNAMKLRSKTKTRFKINLPGLGILYGFWANGNFALQLPDRYLDTIKVDGRYRQPFCEVRVGGRKRPVTIAQLMSKRWIYGRDGLNLWAWREASLKAAETVIESSLAKEKKRWDEERYSATSGSSGKVIL